jgi:hypothetical protein
MARTQMQRIDNVACEVCGHKPLYAICKACLGRSGGRSKSEAKRRAARKAGRRSAQLRAQRKRRAP